MTEGNVLYSTLYRPMATIVADTPTIKGIHELDVHMCNKMLYEHLGHPEREGCWEIASRVLAKYGISAEQIPDPINVFMNCEHDYQANAFKIVRPISQPGDYIGFRLETDLIAAFPVCPFDSIGNCNGDRPTPIKVEIYDAGP